MKRYRCPDCGTVYTTRPHTHWRRFLAAWGRILVSLAVKLARKRWIGAYSRQRQQYWWHGFRQQASRLATAVVARRESLVALSRRWVIVATHSLKDREIRPAQQQTNRTFAATTLIGFG
jgi:uncharacterized membrane protein YcjF (UPF0283 family)